MNKVDEKRNAIVLKKDLEDDLLHSIYGNI